MGPSIHEASYHCDGSEAVVPALVCSTNCSVESSDVRPSRPGLFPKTRDARRGGQLGQLPLREGNEDSQVTTTREKGQGFHYAG